MTRSQKAHIVNSTTDRSIPFAVRAVRAWFRAASAVAPRAAERQAAALFLSPPRKRRSDPPPEDATAGRYALTVRDGEMRIAAWSWGSGPAVLLAHGWGGCAADMAPLAEALQQAGYRAILFDFPAHGRSAGRRTNMVEWLRAIRAVAAAMGPLHALAGHSFGGAAVALALAELGLDARGAVLIAPALGPVYFLEQFRGMTGHIARTIGREPASLDAREAAATLRVPGLVVHDPGDRDVPWSHGESIAQAWPGSRLVRAEGLGHRRLLRDPATLAAATEFIAGLGAREARLAS
jgi:pimeloyl-ACP methyl ester carboxylesterase